MEATANYHKQQSAKYELLEVHYHGRYAWFKRPQVAK